MTEEQKEREEELAEYIKAILGEEEEEDDD